MVGEHQGGDPLPEKNILTKISLRVLLLENFDKSPFDPLFFWFPGRVCRPNPTPTWGLKKNLVKSFPPKLSHSLNLQRSLSYRSGQVTISCGVVCTHIFKLSFWILRILFLTSFFLIPLISPQFNFVGHSMCATYFQNSSFFGSISGFLLRKSILYFHPYLNHQPRTITPHPLSPS